jgi:hypothetical protein
MHQVMATFRQTDQEVVMVVDRSGMHRAHKLDATLDYSPGRYAHGGSASVPCSRVSRPLE